MQVDGGSNCNMLACSEAASLSRVHRGAAASGTIGGIAGGLPYDGVAVSSVSLGGNPLTLAMLHTPVGDRNILSESVLWDEYGILAHKDDPPRLAFPCGSTLPMQRESGLFFTDVTFLGPAEPHRAAAPPPTPIALAGAAHADDLALLWASRLDVDADGLLRLSRATRGISIEKLSPAQHRAISSSMHRAIAQAKHAPVGSTPLADRATEPAERLICDGFGKHHAASPVDGSVYQFHAVCEYSSFGYVGSGKTHTIDDWVAFLRGVVLDAKAHGHNPRRVRFDRAPELRSEELKARLEAELGLSVELTPREHHEGVGRAERNNDLLTRTAEAALQRAGLGTQWLLPARAYAQWLWNRRILTQAGETRYQRYLRKVPDLTAPVPFTFGTTVAIVEDVRGPKGSLEHPRGSIGVLVGVEGTSYLVYRPQRGGVVRQRAVKPLNELSLIKSGLPASVAVASVATQTDSAGWREAIPPAAAAAAPRAPEAAPAPRPAVPTVDCPRGTRLEVLWRPQGSGTPVWYAGKVVDEHEYANGRRRHRVAYDGWPEDQWFWHDLASQDFEWRLLGEHSGSSDGSARARAGGSSEERADRPQTRLRTRSQGCEVVPKSPHTEAGPQTGADPEPQGPSQPASARGRSDDATGEILSSGGAPRARRSQEGAAEGDRGAGASQPARPLPTPSGPLTRSRAMTALALVEHALEATSGARTAATFNAAVFQALGSAGEHLADATDETLDDCRSALCAAASVPIYSLSRSARPECYKATQSVVDVETAVGTQQLVVPSTYKQLLASEQRDHWLAADQAALDAILAHPGNRLVSTAIPQSDGIPIAPCVTQRKVKVDPATKRLALRNAFKSRHCVDGGRLSTLLRRAEQAVDLDTSSAVACDLLVKMLLGDAAVRDRNLVAADVPNAYPSGKRLGRPKTYMALPTAFAHWRADDGSALCIELTTPMWGEGPAGFEWQVELESTLRELGWRQAENVPALWTFSSPEGDARLITIVDDLLFSESKTSGYSISERTVALLSAKYGDLRPVREPTSYAGMAIARDRAQGTLQLTLPQKIVEAAREHYPELLSGERPTSPPPKGAALERLADAMRMPDERGGKLSRAQVRTQQLIGSLKFVEKIHPRLSLVLHRLSCVMSCPPPEAYDVARAALAAAYAERNVGITFGGGGSSTSGILEGSLKANIDLSEPAPSELTAHSDATWGDRNVYGLILTFANAAVLHQTKKIALIVDSSMESEAIASSKAGEAVTYAREILRGLGIPASGPTLVTTDNLANQKVGSGLGCPTRSRHFLRRYHALKQRIADGDVTLRYLPDEQMPADFLTKWLARAKVEKSVVHATNSRASGASDRNADDPGSDRGEC